jgi:hypothetical protein
MRTLPKILAMALLGTHFVGCANAPVGIQSAIPARDAITVVGFVQFPGKYPFHAGMTVADALHAAGSYGRCNSCQQFYNENGWHPSFDEPPELQRKGKLLRLPAAKAEWKNFKLREGDEVKFQHIMF